MKRLSVIIPVYNAERYLKICLDSVLAQDYPEIEIILVDDESTDRSGFICDEYARKNTNIRVLHQKNSGPGFSRNAGLDMCSGQYFTFVDADDYISKNYASKMMRVAEDTNADIVECGNVYMLETHNIFKGCDHSTTIASSQREIENMILVMRHTVWGRIYRSDVLKSVHFSEKRMGEDAEYSQMVLKKCQKYVRFQECLYGYRSYHESITRMNISKKKLDNLAEYNANEFEKVVREILEIISHRKEYILYHKEIGFMITLWNQYEKSKNQGNDLLTVLMKAYKMGDCSVVRKCLIHLKKIVTDIIVRIKIALRYGYVLKD